MIKSKLNKLLERLKTGCSPKLTLQLVCNPCCFGNWKIFTPILGLEKRIMIDIDVIRNGELIRQGTALNDAVIRTRTTHTININLLVNDRPYTKIRGDGVVCATPTGSTAYSFSAGGPIIDVSLPVLAITPICSQLACSRAIILNADSRVVFEMDSEYSTSLALDGEEKLALARGDRIFIKKSSITANIIQLNPISSSEKILGKSKQIREA